MLNGSQLTRSDELVNNSKHLKYNDHSPPSLAKFCFKISNFRAAIRNFASVQTKSPQNFALGSVNFQEVLESSCRSFQPFFVSNKINNEFRRISFAFFLHNTVSQ